MTNNNNTDLNSTLGVNNDGQEKEPSSAPKVLSIIAKINLIIFCILLIPFWISAYGMIDDMFKSPSLAIILSSICAAIYMLSAIGSWAFLKTIAHIGITISEINNKSNQK